MATGTNNTRKTVVRRLTQLVALIFTLLYYPIVMGFVIDEHSSVVCSKVESDIIGNDEDVLISDNELNRIVTNSFPDLSGTKLCDINLNDIEVAIQQTPAVKKCECYTTPGGILHVRIAQRRPIMHVFTSSSSYYMDKEGFRIPARTSAKAHALVVNGNVGSMLDADELIKMCSFINEDKFWKAQIEQIFITNKQEYILVPRVGDHIVEFGNIERMEEKFDLLYRLYANAWNQKEWNLYNKVCLKYRGQVVCTKKSN